MSPIHATRPDTLGPAGPASQPAFPIQPRLAAPAPQPEAPVTPPAHPGGLQGVSRTLYPK